MRSNRFLCPIRAAALTLIALGLLLLLFCGGCTLFRAERPGRHPIYRTADKYPRFPHHPQTYPHFERNLWRICEFSGRNAVENFPDGFQKTVDNRRGGTRLSRRFFARFFARFCRRAEKCHNVVAFFTLRGFPFSAIINKNAIDPAMRAVPRRTIF